MMGRESRDLLATCQSFWGRAGRSRERSVHGVTCAVMLIVGLLLIHAIRREMPMTVLAKFERRIAISWSCQSIDLRSRHPRALRRIGEHVCAATAAALKSLSGPVQQS